MLAYLRLIHPDGLHLTAHKEQRLVGIVGRFRAGRCRAVLVNALRMQRTVLLPRGNENVRIACAPMQVPVLGGLAVHRMQNIRRAPQPNVQVAALQMVDLFPTWVKAVVMRTQKAHCIQQMRVQLLVGNFFFKQALAKGLEPQHHQRRPAILRRCLQIPRSEQVERFLNFGVVGWVCQHARNRARHRRLGGVRHIVLVGVKLIRGDRRIAAKEFQGAVGAVCHAGFNAPCGVVGVG